MLGPFSWVGTFFQIFLWYEIIPLAIQPNSDLSSLHLRFNTTDFYNYAHTNSLSSFTLASIEINSFISFYSPQIQVSNNLSSVIYLSGSNVIFSFSNDNPFILPPTFDIWFSFSANNNALIPINPIPIKPNSWNGNFLVLSNLIFLLCAFILWIQSYRVFRTDTLKFRWNDFFANSWFWVWEMSDYIIVTIASSYYHRCDTPGIQKCIAPYDSLQFMDFFASFILFTTAVTPHLISKYKQIRIIYKSFMTILTLLLLFQHMQDNTPIIVLAILNGLMLVAFNLKRFIFKWKWFPHVFLIPAVAFLIAAVISKFSAPKANRNDIHSLDYYAEHHSEWHLFAGLASACLHLTMDATNSNKNTFNSSSSVSKEDDSIVNNLNPDTTLIES